jgi:hypothetical protein
VRFACRNDEIVHFGGNGVWMSVGTPGPVSECRDVVLGIAVATDPDVPGLDGQRFGALRVFVDHRVRDLSDLNPAVQVESPGQGEPA